MGGIAVGLLFTSFLNGLRHGVDFDHVAAITDIATTQTDKKSSMILSTAYALGHAFVVLCLGVAAVVVGAHLPSPIDSFMSKVIGATLLVLGVYVLYSIVRYRRNVRLQSRWMLIARGVRAVWTRLYDRRSSVTVIEHEHDHGHSVGHDHDHEDLSRTGPGPSTSVALKTKSHTHVHRHLGTVPADPFASYSKLGAFGIGMLHGVGAETPTQLLLFVTAAGIGSKAFGIGVVVSFLVGLFASNTAVAVASSFGLSRGRRAPYVYMGLAAVTAAFSLFLGTAYLLAREDWIALVIGV